MEDMIYCLVDAAGVVHCAYGTESYAGAAAAFGLDESACRKYRFDLMARRLVKEPGNQGSDREIEAYVARYLSTPDRLAAFASEGHLPKRALASVLAARTRQPYLDACAAIEKRLTEECTTSGDPCLEPGCAVEGEICLQPVLRAGAEYHKACAAEWARLFEDVQNRTEAWAH